MKVEGRVWRYGANIDTDVIIPARYLNSFDPKNWPAIVWSILMKHLPDMSNQATSW